MALIQFETTGATGSSTPMIVDMDTPVVVTGCGAGCATFSVAITLTGGGADTIDFAVSPSIPTNDDDIYNTLNAAVRASVADPYAIPVVDSIDVPGGYLQPDTVYVLTGMSV